MGKKGFYFFSYSAASIYQKLAVWPDRESWSRSVSQVPSEEAVVLCQKKPHRAWYCCWEMTDPWASVIQVLECVYFLLFLVRLALFKRIWLHCPLCSLRPTQSFFSLGIIQSNKSCSCRSRNKAPFSHLFATPCISQSHLTVLLWISKTLLFFCWLWIQLLSLGFILSLAGFFIGIWIQCILVLLTTNGILLFLDLIVLYEPLLPGSFPRSCCFYHITSCYLYSLSKISNVLLLKHFTSWHKSKMGNLGVLFNSILYAIPMSCFPLICWDFVLF